MMPGKPTYTEKDLLDFIYRVTSQLEGKRPTVETLTYYSKKWGEPSYRTLKARLGNRLPSILREAPKKVRLANMRPVKVEIKKITEALLLSAKRLGHHRDLEETLRAALENYLILLNADQ